MPAQPQPPTKIDRKWVRTSVAPRVHALAVYIRDRLGWTNMDATWRYLLHFAYYDRDPEAVAQKIARRMGLELPPLDASSGNEQENPNDANG